MAVRANERWAWNDGYGWERDPSVQAYRAYADHWFLVRGQEMLGPFRDDQILRMLRIASCPCVDGCQLGPPGLGWYAVGRPRQSRKEHYWVMTCEDELPASWTRYEPEDLQPVGCCCSNFDSWPILRLGEPLWKLYTSQEPALWGYLKQSWNAHPAGSLVLTQDPMDLGLSVIDWPQQPAKGTFRAL
ncbi:hypothetical protein JST97_05560 [bacterium]|nr:hypothetical protein [bacterium]